MNFSEILNELEQVSPFELYRIMIMIRQQLESPENILKIKRHLKPGQGIAYFDETENRLIEAKVIKLKRTRLLVENEHDGVKWNIPYYYVNIDNIDPMIRNSLVKEGVDKSQLKVGDRIGFLDRQDNEVYGTVIKLNQKTATIKADDLIEWRVSYSFLFSVIEVEGYVEGYPKKIEVLP